MYLYHNPVFETYLKIETSQTFHEYQIYSIAFQLGRTTKYYLQNIMFVFEAGIN